MGPSVLLDPAVAWGSLGVSLLLVLVYELRAHWISRRDPTRQVRFINARMRATWARAMAARPGFEIVAVQALRNSLMSATIAASTAALALMGGLTLGGASLVSGLAHLSNTGGVGLLNVLLGALAITLLVASYVCSAMSMRYYGNATLVVSLPVGSAERVELDPMVVNYVQRAGRLYSWALRLFLMVIPSVAGIVHPLGLVPCTVALLVALHFFDRPAAMELE